MLNTALFIGFPYVAVVLAIVVAIYRYRADRFSYSSQSSQFLENRTLFWGSISWHYSILVILTAHLLALLFPASWGMLIGVPVRLYLLEVTGLALATLAVLGLALLVVRRVRTSRVFAVTSRADWLLLAVLLTQVTTGLTVALLYRWGADWYLHTAAPWIRSLFLFRPDAQYVTALPLLVKVHLLSGVLLVALFPFTRLVHIVTVPVTYLWRPYQVVLWNRRAVPSAGQVPARTPEAASELEPAFREP